MRCTVAILFLLCLFLNSFSQSMSTGMTSSSKKAKKIFEKALVLYNARSYDDALELLEKAVSVDPDFVEAYLVLGNIYLEKGEKDNAMLAFKEALRINPDFYPMTWYLLAEMEFSDGNYQEALFAYRNYSKHPDAFPEYREKCIKGEQNCEFSIYAIKHPVCDSVNNMGGNINTKLPEYFMSITVDGKYFLFTRNIHDERTYDKMNEDFYISEWKDDRWGMSKNLGAPINSLAYEGAATFSPDGQLMIMAIAADIRGSYGEGRSGEGGCDLFYSRLNGDQWTRPINLGAPINSRQFESQPSFSSDGKTLFFIRGTRTAKGIARQDIFSAQLMNNGMWTAPERLSNVVNTSGEEESVFIHPDGKTLYFASNGHIGLGGTDIFMSEKGENGEWSKPENLGYPINTKFNENSACISSDGTLIYLASDREGGFGSMDFYTAELPAFAKPAPVAYLKGKIFDRITRKPLSAKFELIDVETSEVVVRAFANQGNGEYLVSLPHNRHYAFNASFDNYLFYSENFLFKGESVSTEPMYKDIPLDKIEKGSSVVLRNVFFDTDKYELKSESKVELEKLLLLLQKYPEMKIEIGGHTDDDGGMEHNMLLSANRAEAVCVYLVGKGVKLERLSSKGYSYTKPIDSNETPEGRANNRRTEFVIVGM